MGSFKKKRRRMMGAESKQQGNDIIMHSQEQMKSIDFFAGEFNAFNYDSSSGASEDQIYDASLLPSKSYKKEMDSFEPLPFYFDQMSSVADEIDFNNLDKDVDLELEEDCDDLMSTFSSLCSEDDIDHDS